MKCHVHLCRNRVIGGYHGYSFGNKISLKIPENLVTLLSNVIQVLLDKSGHDRDEIEKYLSYVEKSDGKEHNWKIMFIIHWLKGSH